MPLIPDPPPSTPAPPAFPSLELSTALWQQAQIPPASTGATSTSSAIGWTTLPGTWVYGTTDGPTFTMTSTTADYTNILTPKMKIRLVQTTTKYFILTAVAYAGSTTTVTMYGGTDYTLANAAISSTYYSDAGIPYGFPADPTKWMETASSTSDASQSNPVNGTVYQLGPTLSVPIGCWTLRYSGEAQGSLGSAGTIAVRCALSTSSSSVSDADLQASLRSSGVTDLRRSFSITKDVAQTVKTTWNSVALVLYNSATTLAINGTNVTTKITARCAYL